MILDRIKANVDNILLYNVTPIIDPPGGQLLFYYYIA